MTSVMDAPPEVGEDKPFKLTASQEDALGLIGTEVLYIFLY